MLLFNNLIFPVQTYALTGGPSQEEYSAFEPAGTSEMVNLFTGDFTYNIPLLDVDGYPINLSYQCNPGIDQEASWVGFGWVLNAGAITRSVRGVPDDFNADQIHREVDMKDHTSWGAVPEFGVEFGGKGGFTAGVGVVYSSYKGWGYEYFGEPSLALSATATDGGLGGKFNAGMGLRFNSQDGAALNASAGITGEYLRSGERHATGGVLGINIGSNSNSRVGRESWSLGVSGGMKAGKKSNGKKETLYGAGWKSSGTIPLSSTAFSPKLDFDRTSEILNFDFKVGGAGCGVLFYGGLRGFTSSSTISKTDYDYNAYGYLYEQSSLSDSKRYERALMDYARDKDGEFYKETPNAPVTNHTFDHFQANAQGLGGAFRANRNDIGIVYDPRITYKSKSQSVSGEFGFSGDGTDIGLNQSNVKVESESGMWMESDENQLRPYVEFKTDELLQNSNSIDKIDEAYFRFSGEKTYDNTSFISLIGGDKAVRTKLEAMGKKKFRTINEFVDENGSTVNPTISGTAHKSERNKRESLISYLSVSDASNLALERNIKSYAINTTGNYTYPVSNATISRSDNANQKSHHISEISVLQPNGNRYIYGIPVYNRKQKEVNFATTQSPISGTNEGLVNYASENVKSGSRDQSTNQYFESTETPDFAHSYLLTALLSNDYVDVLNDGPSDDDLGDCTWFKYSKISSVYHWRIPAQGTKTAFYSKGMYSDPTDQRGAYTYGQKDIWYPRSIETKNYIAEFILEDRLDGLGVTDEDGTINTSNKLKRLKQIKLYSKSKYDNSSPALIKTVNFEYDYSLCPNTPNSSAVGQGKLTLKKVWFATGASSKGVANPYTFFYCDPSHVGHPVSNPNTVVNSTFNPGYNYNMTDRWGQYKDPIQNPGTISNIEFPYNRQLNAMSYNEYNAYSWNLSTIYTPSGSKISVDYESDDYAYVNDEKAAQMYYITGFGSSPNSFGSNSSFLHNGNITLNGNAIDSYNYMRINLAADNNGSGGMPLTDASGNNTDFKKYFIEHYLNNKFRVYFKCFVELRKNDTQSREYITGYADLDTLDPNWFYSPSGSYVVLKLKEVDIGDKKSDIKINPIAKAALQIGRMAVPKVMYPGSEPLGSTHKDKITTLSASFQEIKALYKGVNKTLALKGCAQKVDLSRSFVRLYAASGKKFGGGSRVTRIGITDGWGVFTSAQEAGSEYGQVYTYTTTDESGRTISSGVANYEPLWGGDENSNRAPIDFSIKASASLNNSLFQETPYCESFYPNSVVGYSKVTVKNLQYADVTRNATGYTEHQFFTTRDFPIKETRTILDKRPVLPGILNRVFNVKNEERLYLSQGFVIKTNDMHGKPKSVKNFAQGQNTELSGIVYNYKTKPDVKELDNVVSVLGADKVLSQQEIGVEIDMINDSRSSKTKVDANTNMANLQTLASCGVPLAFLWFGRTNSKSEFYSTTMTKIVQKFGILESIEKYENNSKTVIKNLLWDKETGEVLMASTDNQFDQPVFTFNYPAHWAYSGMSGAYLNHGIKFLDACNVASSTTYDCGKITTSNASYFLPGDEVAVYSAVSIGSGKYAQGNYLNTCWVIKDLAPPIPSYNTNGQLFLIDRDGLRASTTNVFTNGVSAHYFFKIIRSGHRNMQNVNIGSLVTLSNPIVSGEVNPANNTVLNANAVEYDEKWNMFCEKCTPRQIQDNYIHDTQTPNTIVCSTTGAGSSFFNTLASFFTDINSGAFYTYNVFNYSNYILTNPKLFSHTLGSNTYLFWQHQMQAPNLGVNNDGGAVSTLPWVGLALCNNYCYSLNPFGPSGNPYYKWEDYKCKINTQYLTNWNKVRINLIGTANWSWAKLTGKHDACSESTTSSYIDLEMPNGYDWAQVTSIAGLAPAATLPGYTNTFQGAATLSGGGTAVVTGTVVSACLTALANCVSVSAVPIGDACALNPYLNNLRGVWRPKRQYDYNTTRSQSGAQGGEMKGRNFSDGTYSVFGTFWWYQGNQLQPLSANPSKNTSPLNRWVKSYETDKIDWYGNVYQARNVQEIPVATIYGYNNSLPVASASNAYYTEIMSDGFEDRLYGASGACSLKARFNYGTPNASTGPSLEQAHTGLNSLKLPPGTVAQQTGRMNDFSASTSNSGPTDAFQQRALNSKGIYVARPGDNIDDFAPFSPPSRQKFVLSVWVKVPGLSQTDEYPNVGIHLYTGVSGGALTSLSPLSITRSPMIDGWQKLDYEFGSFSAAGGTDAVYKLEMYNSNSNASAYFDDLRIHPYNASMKTSVYNQKTLRLMAELDDRNFATFYEYDEDLAVVRVKKETDRGVFTLKESRNSLKK